MIRKLKNFFTIGHERSIRAKRNISLSFIVNGLSIGISLMLIPMTIYYVNPSQYGIWLTLSSVIAWFGFFDIGLGNGLRNKFAEALAKGNRELAKIYVSTTYAILIIIISIVVCMFIFINQFLNWATILNAPQTMAKELGVLALVVFVFFCLSFVLKLIATILVADQKPALSGFISMLLPNFLSLMIIYFLLNYTNGSLLYLGQALSVSPFLVLLFASLFFFSFRYREFRPQVKYIQFQYAKDLMNIGVQFFIIQIACLIIFSTSNILISHFFTPAEVTPYNVAMKLFSVATMLFSIVLSPFWSAFTEAYHKGDTLWIKKTMNNLILLWSLMVVCVFVLLVLSPFLYKVWLGDTIHVSFKMSLMMAIYVIVFNWNNIFATFINGTGKIRLQLYMAIVGIIIFYPIALLIIKTTNLGPSGIALATIICLLIGSIYAPIQYVRIVNNKALGIWGK